MTSTTLKYATNLTTGDQGAIHKLKPRSFNKSFSAPMFLTVCRSLLFIIAKYIPLRHRTLLRNRVWFLIITYISFLRNSVLDKLELFGKSTWDFISTIFESSWDQLHSSENTSIQHNISAHFGNIQTPNKAKKNTIYPKVLMIRKIPLPILSCPSKEQIENLKKC